jgi:hypothetical protein
MSHLSSEQISSLLAGNATPETQHHAGTCPECAAEVRSQNEMLSVFGESLHRWSADNGEALIPGQAFLRNESRTFRIGPIRWAVAAAALIVLIVIPLYRNATQRHREAETFEDTLLLEQVNAQLSRAVPAPMEPLMKLVSDPVEKEMGGRQ